LQGFQGASGKTGKLTREILGLPRGSNPSSWSSATALALAGRLERAERWTRILLRAPA
jgi:hypothetical protein